MEVEEYTKPEDKVQKAIQEFYDAVMRKLDEFQLVEMEVNEKPGQKQLLKRRLSDLNEIIQLTNKISKRIKSILSFPTQQSRLCSCSSGSGTNSKVKNLIISTSTEDEPSCSDSASSSTFCFEMDQALHGCKLAPGNSGKGAIKLSASTSALPALKSERTEMTAERLPLPKIRLQDLVVPFIDSDEALESEDILFEVFRYIGTRDLLNFRLVNCKWRNAATSALLARNSCQIVLDGIYDPPVESFRNGSKKSNCNYCSRLNDASYEESPITTILCNDRDHSATLSDLNALILNSPKFPCRSFRFKWGDPESDPHAAELFFIFGPLMKSLSLECVVSNGFLRDILLTHAPNIEELEIVRGMIFSSSFESLFPFTVNPTTDEKIKIRLPHMKSLELKLPCIPEDRRLLKDLIESSINMQSIKNLSIWFLDLIIEQKKTYLIREFTFDPWRSEIRLVQELAKVEPKLKKLKVQFTKIFQDDENYWTLVVEALNSILESSKESLEVLEIHPLTTLPNIELPVMNRVRIIRLGDDDAYYLTSNSIGNNNRDHQRLHFDDDDESDDENNGRRDMLRFGDEDEIIPMEYDFDGMLPLGSTLSKNFPYLHTLQLDWKCYDDDALNFYFPADCYDEEYNEISVIPCLTVKTLEIYNNWPDSFGARALAKKFPNVKELKCTCCDYRGLKNSLWQICPKAESIEIHGISVAMSDRDMNRQREARHYHYQHLDGARAKISVASIIDSFFTGIPPEMCRKLEIEELPVEMRGDAFSLRFLRTSPAVCDVYHLKTLKLVFSELRAPFMSHVSGKYGFKLMPDLTVTFAYDQSPKYAEENKDMEEFLKPAKPYVRFRHEKRPDINKKSFEGGVAAAA